jgi:hypothetical protein
MDAVQLGLHPVDVHVSQVAMVWFNAGFDARLEIQDRSEPLASQSMMADVSFTALICVCVRFRSIAGKDRVLQLERTVARRQLL